MGGVVRAEVPCEVSVNEAFEAFGSVGSVVNALILVTEEIADDAFGSCLMEMFGFG